LRRQNLRAIAGLALLGLGLYYGATGHVIRGLIWVALGLSFVLMAQIQAIPVEERPQGYGQMLRNPRYAAAIALGLVAFGLIVFSIVKDIID
jgi:hypothetical protein